MAKANGKTVKKPVVAKKRGGCTGKGFIPGKSGRDFPAVTEAAL
jgi:hypothetical protein